MRTASIFALVAVALVIGACGDVDDAEARQTPQTEAPPPTPQLPNLGRDSLREDAIAARLEDLLDLERVNIACSGVSMRYPYYVGRNVPRGFQFDVSFIAREIEAVDPALAPLSQERAADGSAPAAVQEDVLRERSDDYARRKAALDRFREIPTHQTPAFNEGLLEAVARGVGEGYLRFCDEFVINGGLAEGQDVVFPNGREIRFEFDFSRPEDGAPPVEIVETRDGRGDRVLIRLQDVHAEEWTPYHRNAFGVDRTALLDFATVRRRLGDGAADLPAPLRYAVADMTQLHLEANAGVTP